MNRAELDIKNAYYSIPICEDHTMKPCHVENETKTIINGFLSQVSMGLILVFTQLF